MRIYVLSIGLTLGPAAIADPVACRGRCVLLETPGTAGAPMHYLDELGLVEGADLGALDRDCAALAAARPEKRARGFVVEHLSIAPRDRVKVVVDYAKPTSCDRRVNVPTTSEQSLGAVAKQVFHATLEIVSAFFWSNASRL